MLTKDKAVEYFKNNRKELYKYGRKGIEIFKARCEKARCEQEKTTISREKIIEYVNEFLTALDVETIPSIYGKDDIDDLRAPYSRFYFNYNKKKYNKRLKDKNDIVWMKFTKSGHLVVVATSADIKYSFEPFSLNSEKKYSDDEYRKKYLGKKCTMSTIIIHELGRQGKEKIEEWNDEFVLVFPLFNIKEKGFKRKDIESGIGKYLIYKNVPILNYFSHIF